MNTLKKLRRLTKPKPPRAGRLKHPSIRQVINRPNHDREKPPQPTIVRRITVRRMQYLVNHRLCAKFDVSNMRVPATHYRKVDPITKNVTSEKIDDKSPTFGV